MVSPTIAPKSPVRTEEAARQGRLRGPFTALQVRRGQHRWPADPWSRQAVRLALCLPGIVFAVVVGVTTPLPAANVALAEHGLLIRWGADDLSWVSQIWPPLPTAIAGLARGGLVAMAVVAAFFSGGLLHSLIERMVQAGIRPWLIAVAVPSVAVTPLVGYLITHDLAQFMALVFVAMALSGFLRFALDGRTEGGFQAGLLLALGTACDLSTVFHALAMAAAAPLIAHLRYRGQRGAGRATAVVLAFPSVAVVAAWAFLEWRFTGRAFTQVLDSGAFSFPGGGWESLGRTLRSVGRAILLTPAFLLAFVLIARRSLPAALGYLIPIPGLVLGLWLGLRPPTGMTVLVLSFLALFAFPRRLSRPVQVVAAVVLVAQAVLTWTVTLDLLPAVQQWWTAL